MLELKNINKYYHSGTVNEMCLFDGFDLTIKEGEFVSVVGSNGSGKTSMLNIICGSIPVESGQILMLLMSVMTPVDFLILDEHTAALDPKTADRIMELTEQIVREKKLTTIMVTHNLRYAVEYGNRLLMMHQGNVILDKKGEEKEKLSVEQLLGLFNEISIECGN